MQRTAASPSRDADQFLHEHKALETGTAAREVSFAERVLFRDVWPQSRECVFFGSAQVGEQERNRLRGQRRAAGRYLWRTTAVGRAVATSPTFRLAQLDHGGAPPTMLCGFIGDLQLCLNGPEAPRDREWTSFLRSPLLHGNTTAISLVHTVGGGPNPAQRQETTEFRRTDARVRPRCAILTDVAFHRAFINVVNVFERVPFRAFPSRDLKKALSYLGATIPEAEVRRLFAYMAGLLGIVGYRLPLSTGSDVSSLQL